MKIMIESVPESERKPKPRDESKLGFGKVYSDHMFTMEWTAEQGWRNPTISKYRPLQLDPATLVFHYGQSVFEGLKAYRTEKGTINLFRPDQNAARFNRSAARLDMPTIDPADMLEFIHALVELDRDWVPRTYGTSLYIRPFMIATEPYLGLKSSHHFLFLIITGPVGAYYPEGFNPVKIQVCEKYSRAGPGGLGAAKTAANYAASLLAEKEAIQSGFTQVLWLDACERRYLEEVGSMNIFFKIAGKVITPPLGGTTLAGVTRSSVMQLVRHWGIPAEERRISIDEVIGAHEGGKLEEVFGAGTAAVISPVGLLQYKAKDHRLQAGGTGSLAQRLFSELMGMQYGMKPDPFGWVVPLEALAKRPMPAAQAR
jgi:branched-chain amino acid aminotransferase